MKVLLSGEGADEALLGYARHQAARMLPRRGLRIVPGPQWSMRRGARTARALLARDPYAELLAVSPPGFRAAVLTREFAEATLPAVDSSDRLSRARAIDQAFYLRWDLLPKLDVATMAAGVEGRCPFLDTEVRAACARLTPRAALGKRPLRRAYRARLPAVLFRQRKRGFALPLDKWFRTELPWLDLLRDARTRQRGHLRPAGLDDAVDRHRRGSADLGHALYLLVAYELYLRAGGEEPACA